MSHVLLSVPEELVEQFINHLGRLKPDISKHITIRVLDDSYAQEIINDFNACAYRTALSKMNKDDFEREYLGKWEDVQPAFPVKIPDTEWDDGILPLEDLLDHTGGHTREEHQAPEFPFRKTDKEYLQELDHQNIMDQIDRQYE